MPKGCWEGRSAAWQDTCSFETCENQIGKKSAKGLCLGHYQQLRHRKDLSKLTALQGRMVKDPAPEGHKTCRKCKMVLPLSDFFLYRKSTDGMSLYCRSCESYNKKLRTHNVSREHFDSMLEGQGSRCAICNDTFSKQPVIDHDHSRGSVRGLLCNGCNLGLGAFRDTPEFLISAAWYLKGGGS